MPKNAAPGEFLSPRQVTALQVLAGGGSTSEAATAAGVNIRSVERWMRQKEFRNALRTTQAAVIDSIAARLVALAKVSVETLHDVLSDKEASHSIKVRVAVAALEAAAKWHQATAVEERLAAVEEVLQAKYGH